MDWVPVRFRLLGRIECHVDGGPVDVGHARQRLVLAALAADVNHTVSIGQLVERVWGCVPPQQVRGTLYSYLSRLRKALAAVDGVELTRTQEGYLLSADAEAVDAHRFRAVVARARAVDDDERASELFDEALRLWRGEPLAAVDGQWVCEMRSAWERELFAARLDHHDVLLRLGRHGSLVASLTAQVRENPLDERLAGQLMLALYRCGRTAEGLRSYQQVRSRLAEELGIDPNPALRRLHQQVLTADPGLDLEPTTATRAASPASAEVAMPVPRQLPMPPARFTGRSAELAALSAAYQEQSEPVDTVLISLIGGIGGIGKTCLALRWAHDHTEEFGDGQLYADLRGFDPSAPPVAASEVLHSFLVALGVRPEVVPPTADARAGLFRSLLTDRRILIVLDNAGDTAQVQALLPGSPTCTVLVTSRSRLDGLVSGNGARQLSLGVLTDAESRDLLARYLDQERLNAEPEATAALLRSCAGLPLALSIIAARAAAQPDFPLAVLADELREAAGRLDALETGEVTGSLRAVFDTSYRALDEEAARAFALLGLAKGPDIGPHAAASLIGHPLPRTQSLLRMLQAAHLVQEYTPGRYRMHDLVRLYATERGTRDQTEQGEALRRLVDFYTHTGYRASRMLAPDLQIDRSPGPAAAEVIHLPLADAAAAARWCATEAPCLVGAQQLAAELDWHTAVWQLPAALFSFGRPRMDYNDNLALWQAALAAAAGHLGEHQRAVAHLGLGRAHAALAQCPAAMENLDQAVTLFGRTGNVLGQTLAHLHLGTDWNRPCDHQRELWHTEQALLVYQQADTAVWEGVAHNNMGWTYALLGDYERARGHAQKALALCRDQKDHYIEALTLDTLGFIARKTGQHTEALDYYQRALTGFRHVDSVHDAADTLARIGEVQHVMGEDAAARSTWRQAVALYRARHASVDAERVQDKLDAINEPGPDHPPTAPSIWAVGAAT